jgi:rubrerythrin
MLAPFERQDPPPVPAGVEVATPSDVDLVWRCSRCGYQRLAVNRPDRCAGCGAPGAQLVGRTAIEWRFLLRQPPR